MTTNNYNSDERNEEKSDCIMKDLKQQTDAFIKNDRAPSTLSRNGTNSRYFTNYVLACVPRFKETHPAIKATLAHEYIHADLLMDSYLAEFMTFIKNYHQLKGNKCEPNCRAAHGFVAHSINKNGRDSSEFPEFRSCWDGIRKTDEYIDSSKHEQALAFGLKGHVAIININPFDHDMMFIPNIVKRLDCYHHNTGSGVRTVNIWSLKERKMLALYMMMKEDDQK